MNTENSNKAIFEGLLSSFIAIYYVDLDTGAYFSYLGKDNVEKLKGLNNRYTDFFNLVRFFIISGFVHPDDSKNLRSFYPSNEAIKIAMRNKKRISLTFRRRYYDGYHWVKSSIIKNEEADGEVHSVTVALNECDEDIIGHRQLEEKNARFEMLKEVLHSCEWCFKVDADNQIVAVEYSKDLNRLLNINLPAEPHAWEKIVHPEDVDAAVKAFNDTIADRSCRTPYDVIYRMIDCNGEYKWFRSAGRIMRDTDGSGEFIGIQINITDSIQQERELRLRQERAARAIAAKEQILSNITQSLYGYNVTVNIENGEYTLITGTGAEEAVAVMKKAGNYRELCDAMMKRVRPQYHNVLRRLLSLDYLRINKTTQGFFGTERYQLLGDEETARWGEVNISFAIDENGNRIANVLGRDITDLYRETARHEREIKAAIAKDQILSGITQTLYGFNITVNLKKNTFTLIKGNGTEYICEIFESCLDKTYTQAADAFINYILPDYKVEAYLVLGRDVLMELRRKNGHLGTKEFPWRDVHGECHWCEINCFMATDDLGDPIVNLLGRDVTAKHQEQERRERQREASAAKDRVLAEVTKALYGYNLTVNLKTLKYTLIIGTGMDAACEIFKSSDDYEQAIRLKLTFISPKDHDKIARLLEPEALKKMAAEGVTGAIGAITYEANVNGINQWHETNVFIGTDVNGDPIANILGRDITAQHNANERREREREAAAAKDRVLSEITRTLYGYNLTVNLKTLKYKIIVGSGMNAACRIFNSSDDYAEAIRLKCEFVMPHDRERICALLDPASLVKMAAEGVTGAVGSATYEAIVDGEHQWHETNVFIGTNVNGDPIANILGRNITEQHERADAKEKLLVAIESSKAKSEFLFNVSHDVRTPMHAIMGFVDMAMNNPNDSQKVMECLSKIRKSGSLLFSIINSILDMSQLEVGKAKLAESVGDVMLCFESMKSTMNEVAKEKNITLKFEFSNIRNRYIYVDHEKANRVLVNIISNALRYTNEGGKVLVKCEEITGEKSGYAYFRYTFTDNGIGMSPEFIGHIYDRFSREKNTTAGGVAGIGLGMSICKSFLEIMGGTINCKSQQGVGTTFTVILPCRLQENGKRRYIDPVTGREIDANTSNQQMIMYDFQGKRALIVDDSKFNREVSKHYLKVAGFEVEGADDGKMAFDTFVAKGPGYYDVILMDIQMPVMDGFESARQIRQWEENLLRDDPSYKAVPIIAWSANAFDEDRKKSLESGMNEHVAKGIKIIHLYEIISKFL